MRAQRDFQTAEVLGMSLREQLAAREGELAQLAQRHSELQAEQAGTRAVMRETQASLAELQAQHTSLQASSSEAVQQADSALTAERAALADARRLLACSEEQRLSLEQTLQGTAVREAAVTSQLAQLARAHEQQTGELQQEAGARRCADDELEAIRAGLQVRGVAGRVQQDGNPAKGRAGT